MDQNQPSNDARLNLPFVEQGGERDDNRHLPFADRLNDTVRNHFVACIGEFLGTFFFLFLGLSGAQVAVLTGGEEGEIDQVSRMLYISLSFGFALAVNVWTMYRVSGGLFNPAVTIGMCLVSAIPWVRGGLLIISQVLGAVASSLIVKAIFPGALATTKLNEATGINATQGFFIELFLTSQFVFSIMMMAGEKHAATFMAPIGIGLSLFVAELSGVYFTGGSLNPARSFGPALATGDFSGDHWIYWAGPIAGAVVAAGFYKLLLILEYERANPGQDAAEPQKGSGGSVRLD